MPIMLADGIETRYEVSGQGPVLLMFAPGGFDAVVERWKTAGAWRAMNAMEVLPKAFRTVIYDRREAGDSGGRIETLTWERYARQGYELLKGLGIDSAYILGACMGCSIALSFAAKFPSACQGLILHWPVGGHRWNLMGRDRFGKAARFAREAGMAGVATRAVQSGSFWSDPEAGPWARPAARDRAFAQMLTGLDLERYIACLATSEEALFRNEFPTGVHPAEVLAIQTQTLIVPGGDEVHTRSAAYGLAELLRNVEVWDVPVASQLPGELHDRILNAAHIQRRSSAAGGTNG